MGLLQKSNIFANNLKSDVVCSKTKIPLDPAMISTCEEFSLDSTTVALSGGEDYELLFTISQSDYDKIKGNPNLTGHRPYECGRRWRISRDSIG
jgi:thiamine-monophosphate kinase